MMKPITIWKVIKEDKETGKMSLKHNHIEDGWILNTHPKPLSEEFSNQKAWSKMNWCPVLGYMIDGKIVKSDFMGGM